MPNFRSTADKIRFYTRKLLSDGKAHTVKEIKEYIYKETQENFTDGCYAGALRDLVAKEDGYEKIGYGSYMNMTILQGEIDLTKACRDILDKTISGLSDEFNKKNVLKLTDDDLKLREKVNNIISFLEKAKNDLV